MMQTQLRLAIEQAVEAVALQPDHSLKPIYRQSIYSAFGLGDKWKSHRTRGWLDILASRYVLPIWEQVWPDDDTPRRLLLLAENLLRGAVDQEVARQEENAVWMRLQGRDEEARWQAHEEACCAKQVAIQAVSWLINPEPQCEEISEDDTDADTLDPVCSDSAMWAAAAYSGAMWSVEPNATRNETFWMWWLNEAIPRALELA